MFTTVSLSHFTDFLPFNWGSLWRFLGVKKPTRPLTAQEQARRFHWVTWDGKDPIRPDDLMGFVYITDDNKAVYWSGSDSDAVAKRAYYLPQKPEHLLANSQSVSFNEIHDNAGTISDEDRKQLVCNYYGTPKGMTLLAHTLG